MPFGYNKFKLKDIYTLNINSGVRVQTSVAWTLLMNCNNTADIYLCLLCMWRGLGITCSPAL